MADIEVERAQQLLDLGRYEEAVRAVTPVLARAPGDPQAHLVAGWATRGLDRPADAWEHARAAAEAAPDEGEALALMALCDLETQDPARRDRARMLGRRAVMVEPWNPVSHVALVHTLLDDPASTLEARAAADAALRQFPENALFLTLAAKARLVSGTGIVEHWDQAAARVLLEHALRLEPTHREARQLLGALDGVWGRDRSTLRGLSELLAEDPTDEVTHASLRAWLLGTATTWSIGLGVVTITELWSLLASPPRASTFATALGWVSLLAVLVRVASAHLASGGATTRAAAQDPRVRWATGAPVAAAVLLAVGPLLGVLAVPALSVAAALLVWGAVNGARA